MMDITTEGEGVLASFAQLSHEQQVVVGQEIQKRIEAMEDPFADVDFSPLDAEELTFLTRRQFAMLDEEEALRDGCP